MHYYEFNVGDYRRRTTHLTPIEHYIYRTLLDWYFLNEQPLKADMNYLLRILGLTKRNEAQVQNVLDDFFFEEDGVYHNKRADEMLSKYKTKQETNSENGKKGGRPKKSDDNQSETDTKPNKNPNETELKPNEKPTNNHKPITNIDIHTNAHEKNFDSSQDFEGVMKWVNAWQPTMHEVNSVLQMAGEKHISQNAFDQMKFSFVSYYQPKLENNSMQTSQLLGKLVSWIKNQKINQISRSKSGKANNETHQSNSVTEYRDTLQQQYNEYWASQAEQGIDRPSLVDVH